MPALRTFARERRLVVRAGMVYRSLGFAALAQDGSLLLGVVAHDRLPQVWELEALYD